MQQHAKVLFLVFPFLDADDLLCAPVVCKEWNAALNAHGRAIWSSLLARYAFLLRRSPTPEAPLLSNAQTPMEAFIRFRLGGETPTVGWPGFKYNHGVPSEEAEEKEFSQTQCLHEISKLEVLECAWLCRSVLQTVCHQRGIPLPPREVRAAKPETTENFWDLLPFGPAWLRARISTTKFRVLYFVLCSSLCWFPGRLWTLSVAWDIFKDISVFVPYFLLLLVPRTSRDAFMASGWVYFLDVVRLLLGWKHTLWCRMELALLWPLSWLVFCYVLYSAWVNKWKTLFDSFNVATIALIILLVVNRSWGISTGWGAVPFPIWGSLMYGLAWVRLLGLGALYGLGTFYVICLMVLKICGNGSLFRRDWRAAISDQHLPPQTEAWCKIRRNALPSSWSPPSLRGANPYVVGVGACVVVGHCLLWLTGNHLPPLASQTGLSFVSWGATLWMSGCVLRMLRNLPDALRRRKPPSEKALLWRKWKLQGVRTEWYGMPDSRIALLCDGLTCCSGLSLLWLLRLLRQWNGTAEVGTPFGSLETVRAVLQAFTLYGNFFACPPFVLPALLGLIQFGPGITLTFPDTCAFVHALWTEFLRTYT